MPGCCAAFSRDQGVSRATLRGPRTYWSKDTGHQIPTSTRIARSLRSVPPVEPKMP